MIAPFAAPLDEIFTVLADAAIRVAKAGAVSLIGDVKAGSILSLRCHKNILRLANLNGARILWLDSGAEVVLRDHVEPVMMSGETIHPPGGITNDGRPDKKQFTES